MIDGVADAVSSLLSTLILGVLVLAIFKYLPERSGGMAQRRHLIHRHDRGAARRHRADSGVSDEFRRHLAGGGNECGARAPGWLYLEAQILLAGAELNRAIELRDTPTAVDAGGQRRQEAADTHPSDAD